ncbi:MAG TPA: hypothetical protein VFQ65_24520 [Kofleriaceae bacterium]|nr:hypothetical protein [Kofleriaceae bacterium]
MWRTVLMVVALVGCVDPNKSSRWPGHRKDHDARLDKLASQLEAENEQIVQLSNRITELEAQLAHVQPAAASAPSAPATPDTSK